VLYALQKQKTSEPKIKFSFMTQTMDLNKMGLAPLEEFQMLEIDGGALPKWMKAFGVGWLVDQVISNWDDIKVGAKEGWNSVSYK